MASEIIKKKRGRKKGTPKTGGRKAGTPNRNSRTVLEALDRIGAPIIEFLVCDIQTLEPHQRIPLWLSILSFCYPRLKDLEPLVAPPAPPADAPEKKPALDGVPTEELAKIARKPTEPKADA